MSFLRRLFSGKAESKVERSPRIRLLLSDGARFEGAEGDFPILNLSESGIGLLAENREIPDRLKGNLVLGREVVPLELQVVRRNEDFIGARFAGDITALRAVLRRQFTEEIKATEMSEVGSSRLQEEAEGNPRWFYAPDNYELFFLESGGGIRRMELEWNGRVVAAAAEEPLKVGTIDSSSREKPDHAKSALVNWESQVSAEDRAKAIRIIENIPGLDADSKGKLVALIRS